MLIAGHMYDRWWNEPTVTYTGLQGEAVLLSYHPALLMVHLWINTRYNMRQSRGCHEHRYRDVTRGVTIRSIQYTVLSLRLLLHHDISKAIKSFLPFSTIGHVWGLFVNYPSTQWRSALTELWRHNIPIESSDFPHTLKRMPISCFSIIFDIKGVQILLYQTKKWNVKQKVSSAFMTCQSVTPDWHHMTPAAFCAAIATSSFTNCCIRCAHEACFVYIKMKNKEGRVM